MVAFKLVLFMVFLSVKTDIQSATHCVNSKAFCPLRQAGILYHLFYFTLLNMWLFWPHDLVGMQLATDKKPQVRFSALP